MAERKFTLGLNKPGMAAQLRETVSQVVRESAVLVSFFFFFFICFRLSCLFFFSHVSVIATRPHPKSLLIIIYNTTHITCNTCALHIFQVTIICSLSLSIMNMTAVCCVCSDRARIRIHISYIYIISISILFFVMSTESTVWCCMRVYLFMR